MRAYNKIWAIALLAAVYYLTWFTGHKNMREVDLDQRKTTASGMVEDTTRAFVCITGQLPRLELTNKIEHLLRPWTNGNGVEIDIALVLSDSDLHSKPVPRRSDRRRQEYFAMDEVVDELSRLPGVRVLNSDVDVESVDPVVNGKYLEQRSKNSRMSSIDSYHRVQNHLRKFESLARCHRHMVGTGRTYDMVHRVREDHGYHRPIDYHDVRKLVWKRPMTIVSSNCAEHGGMNDRGSFVSPDAAYDYFNHPILYMYTHGPMPGNVSNTEKFLKWTYSQTCHLEYTDGFYLFRRERDGPNGNVTYLSSKEDLMCVKRLGL